MTEQNETYPPPEPEGTQPRFPREGVPADPIVGNKMGSREDESEARGSSDSGEAEETGS